MGIVSLVLWAYFPSSLALAVSFILFCRIDEPQIGSWGNNSHKIWATIPIFGKGTLWELLSQLFVGSSILLQNRLKETANAKELGRRFPLDLGNDFYKIRERYYFL